MSKIENQGLKGLQGPPPPLVSPLVDDSKPAGKSSAAAVARGLVARIARITPPDLPWEYVTDWTVGTVEDVARALRAFDAEDTPETRRRLWKAGERWVCAWKRACEAWVEEGKPSGAELDQRYQRVERVGMLLDVPMENTNGKGEAA